MSDDYDLSCPKCYETGGSFTRQMWGWGNCDIVEMFRFITFHVSVCGAKSLNIAWEQDDEYLDAQRGTRHITEWDAFPHSHDWDIQSEYRDGKHADLHKWWTERLIADGYVQRAEKHNEWLKGDTQ